MNKENRLSLSAVFLLIAIACSFINALLFLFIVLALVAFIIEVIRKKRVLRWKTIDTLFVIALALFLLSGLLSPINKSVAIGTSAVFAAYGLLFFLVSHIDEAGFPVKLVDAVAFMLIVLCLFSLIHFIINRPIVIPWQGKTVSFPARDPKQALSSLLQYPAFFGNFLGLHLAFLLAFLGLNREKVNTRQWTVAGIAGLLGVVCLILTQSRGGLFIVAFTYFIVFFFVSKKVKLLMLVPVGLVLVMLCVYTPKKWITMMRNPLQEGNIQSRLYSYNAAWEMYKEQKHYLTGTGLMTFRNWFTYERRVKYLKSRQPDYPNFIHNVYLSFLVETGILGLVTFLLWLGALLRSFIRRIKKKPDWLAVGGLALTGVFIFHSIFDNIIYVGVLGVILFFYWALFYSAIRQSPPEDDKGGVS